MPHSSRFVIFLTLLITFLVIAGMCIMFAFNSPSRRVPAEYETQSSNPKIAVEFVLSHEGVKIYRFHDGVRYIYFTDMGSIMTGK